MAEVRIENGRLDSWKEIASYLGKTVRTAIRWEHTRGLPVHRLPGGTRQSVFAYRHELDAWMEGAMATLEAELTDGADLPNGGLDLAAAPSAVSALLPRSRALRILLFGIALTSLSAAVFSLRVVMRPRPIRIVHVLQLTNDGTIKDALVTDGRKLFFSEHRGGQIVLSSIPVGGGAIEPLPTDFRDGDPIDISPDGKTLLVRKLETQVPDGDSELWLVPIDGGAPRRAGQVHCHTASWAPDGTQLAYAERDGLYLAHADGSAAHLLHRFEIVPHSVRWFPDGKRLRVNLRDARTGYFSFWDLILNVDRSSVAAIIPTGASVPDSWGAWSLDNDGTSFVVGTEFEASFIYVVRRKGMLPSGGFAVEKLAAMHGAAEVVEVANQGRLFAIAASGLSQAVPYRTTPELLRFDPVSRGVRPFLPGVSATDIDYDATASRIVYVSPLDGSVWISRPDGSARTQIVAPGQDIELPRWSPDGKWIAYTVHLPEKPWRVFIVPSAGGTPREASNSSDSQGAPTWSPDGRLISYGNVHCRDEGTCAIHIIQLSTGQVSTLPGSEGLFTARWSPDGRSIAALRPDAQEVAVYDVARQQWKTVASNISGNDLSWSRDSAMLYASNPAGTHPGIERISIRTGKIDTYVDFSDFAKGYSRIQTWFALAPDGAVLFNLDHSANEIYSLDYSH